MVTKYPSTIYIKHHRNAYLFAVLSWICIALLLGGATNQQQTPQSVQQVPLTGVSSWSEQLSVAKQEAHKIDENAVVHWITAKVESCNPNEIEPAEVTFYFIRPSGKRISVTILDSNPPKVVQVHALFDTIDPAPTKDDFQKYNVGLSSVRLSPREACQATFVESDPVPSIPSVSMYLTDDRQATFGVPSVWGVVYYERERNQQLAFFVSPTSGNILKKIRNDLSD